MDNARKRLCCGAASFSSFFLLGRCLCLRFGAPQCRDLLGLCATHIAAQVCSLNRLCLLSQTELARRQLTVHRFDFVIRCVRLSVCVFVLIPCLFVCICALMLMNIA